jgi:hypothetical protein
MPIARVCSPIGRSALAGLVGARHRLRR